MTERPNIRISVALSSAAIVVSLPMFPELTGAQIERVCSAIAEFHRR